MTFKRKALGALTRVELLEVGKALELDVTTNMRLDEMMDVVAGSKKRGILEKVLALLELAPIPWTRGLCCQRTIAQVSLDLVRGPVVVV